MFRTTYIILALVSIPSLAMAQQPQWQWTNATYNNGQASTELAPIDPTYQTAMTPARNVGTYQPTVVNSVPANTYTAPVSRPVTAYKPAVTYNNMPTTAPRQVVQRTTYPTTPTQPVQVAAPTANNSWYTLGSTPVSVQRAGYNAPVVYNAPVTVGRPTTVYRPVSAADVAPSLGPAVVGPAPIAAPAAIPVGAPGASTTYLPIDRTAYRPVLPIGSLEGNAYISSSMYGSAKVYKDDQPVRNFFRYIFP